MIAGLLLMAAIGLEVGATSLLGRSQGFTSPTWTAIVLTGYAGSFVLLAQVVKTMPVSVAYAVWSGVGTAAIAAIGAMFLGEPLNPLKIICLGLIIVGVVGLNLSGASH